MLLAEVLRKTNSPRTYTAVVLYSASILVMLVPLIGLVWNQPQARATLRVLLERLRGG